eukprot:scaffold126340_cov78-Phaeocystis_antarctica.AAC.3
MHKFESGLRRLQPSVQPSRYRVQYNTSGHARLHVVTPRSLTATGRNGPPWLTPSSTAVRSMPLEHWSAASAASGLVLAASRCTWVAPESGPWAEPFKRV